MDREKVVKKLQNSFKIGGFIIRRTFCLYILEKFIDEGIDVTDKENFDNLVVSICNSLENQCLIERSIEKEHIEDAIQMCFNRGYDNTESTFSVINAFDFPKLLYNLKRKQYFIVNEKPQLLANAESKARLFLERYTTVLQRTKRNFFLKGDELKLQTVDYLLALQKTTLDKTLILGSLFQISEGKWCLEDPSGIIELNLIHAKFNSGFFNESCLVLVNGYYEEKILHVSSIVLPPGEDYKNSRSIFGNINYFGGPSKVPLRDSVRLKEQMARNKADFMLFFSDLWLDYPNVFDKLESLFSGFQDVDPIAFIFMGNFMSNSHGSEMMDVLKKHFKRLGELIVKFPSLAKNSQFIFIPGMADPCMPHIVPRFGLPSYVTSDIKKLVPKATFATNPCRIQYCTREIVLFRADLMPKLLRGTLHKPSKDELLDSVRRTIVSQGHLSPLSLNALTVQWDYDYCLRLYPLPDLVVIGDKCESYEGDYKECRIANPGSFCESGFQFLSYIPFANTIDDCSL